MEERTNQNYDPYTNGNEEIEKAIHQCYLQSSPIALMGVLTAIHLRMVEDGHLIVPVDVFEGADGSACFNLKAIQLEDQQVAVPAFTSQKEFEKGPQCGALSHFIDSVLAAVYEQDDCAGLLLNPFGESFLLTKDLISAILVKNTTTTETYKPQ